MRECENREQESKRERGGESKIATEREIEREREREKLLFDINQYDQLY